MSTVERVTGGEREWMGRGEIRMWCPDLVLHVVHTRLNVLVNPLRCSHKRLTGNNR